MATRFDLLRARPGGLLGAPLTPEEEEEQRRLAELAALQQAPVAPVATPAAAAAPDPNKKYNFGDAIYELGLSPEDAIKAGFIEGADPAFVQQVLGRASTQEAPKPEPEVARAAPPKVLDAAPDETTVVEPTQPERKKPKLVLDADEVEQVARPVAPKVLDGPPDEMVTQAGPDVLGQARGQKAISDALDKRAQAQGNVETDGRLAAYRQRVEQLANSKELFNATPEQLNAEARRVANEEFGDAALFGQGFNFGDVAKYRQEGGTRASKVQQTGEATTRSTDEAPTLTQSLAKGGATTMQLVWAGGEALNEVLGDDKAAKMAGDKRRMYGALASVLPEGVKFDQSLDSFGNAMQFAKQTLAEQGVLMVGPMTGAVAGKIIAGSMGARLGAFGPSWALGVGEVQSSNKQISEDQKAGVATIVGGSAIAALDSIFTSKVGSMLAGSLGKEAAEEVSLRILLMPMSERIAAVARKGAVEGGKGLVTEGSTEAAQTVIGELATSIETGTPIQPGLLGRIVESAAVGGLMGKVIGGATGVATEAAQQRGSLRDPIREMADARYATPASDAVAQRMSPSQGDVPNRPRTVLDEAPEGEVIPQRPIPPARPATRSGDGLTTVAPTRRPVSKDGKEQDFLIPKGRVSSRFGPRKSFTTDNGQQASSNHAGIDVALPRGAAAPAGADGVVVFAGKRGGYGNQVVVKHSDGTTSSYSHLGKITVQQGDSIERGQRVGSVGSTGNATGPHLHLERRDAKGRPINPLTAGPVETVDNGDGTVDDNTEWDVKQEPLEELPDFLPEETEAMEETWTETTGTTIDYDAAPVEEAVATVPQNEAIPEPIRNSPVPEPAATVERTAASLDEAQTRNPARIALEELQTRPAADVDWTQPQETEEPVFGQDESGYPTQEVVAFINREGAARRVGEAPAGFETGAPSQIDAPTTAASPAPSVGVSPTGEAGASSLPTPEENRAAALDAIIAALPPIPSRASEMVREARTLGRQAAAGAVEVVTDFSGQPKGFETAYKLGLREGSAAVAKATESGVLASFSAPNNGPTPVATESSAPVIENVPTPEPSLPAEPAPVAAPPKPKRGRPPLAVAREREIDTQVEKIDERLFDLENEGDKGAVKRYAQRLVREGVIEQDELNALAYMFKDRDMGAEDVVSELRTSVQIWADNQKKAGTKAKRRVDTAPAADDFSYEARTRRAMAEVAEAMARKKALTAETKAAELRAQLAAVAEGRAEQETRANEAEARAAVAEATAEQSAEAIAGPQEEERSEQTERARAEPRGPEPDRVSDAEVLERPPVEADGTIILDHWSAQEGLTETDPAFTATNKAVFSRQERAYLSSAPPRTYFGIQTNQPGGYKLEFTGRDKYQGRVSADRLYDAATDPNGLWQRGKPAASERAIQAAGYAGYWVKNPELGLVAIVFEKVPVTRADAPAAQEPRQRVTATEVAPADAMKASVQDVAMDTLRQMGLDGKVDLEVVERIAAPEGQALGEFSPTDMRIRIAAFPVSDVRHTTKHEVIHWAREARLFDRAEWSALSAWAKADPFLMAWAKENYPTLNTEEQVEEAIAEGFARWNGGMKLDNFSDDSLIGRAFAKLRDFIRALRMAFNAAGVTRGQLNAAAQTLHDLQSGELAKRLDAPKPKFGRKVYKDRLSKDLLSGRITPEEHHFLRQNPDTKYQAAWHGSPAADIDRFSLDFIGQGEGAQAFGWGLYFAQKRDIAEWYQKKLTMETNVPVDQMVMVNGQPMRDFFAQQQGMSMAGYEVADRVFDFLTQNQPYNGWLDQLEVLFHKDVDGWVRSIQEQPTSDEGQAEIDDLEASRTRVEAAFRSLRMKKVELATPPSKGALYKVEVPDDEMLLDLDVELDQQSPKVKAALAKLKAHLEKRDLLDEYEDQMNLPFEEWTGADVQFKIGKRMVYDDAMPYGDEPGASDSLESAVEASHAAMASSILLRNLGIPGNRYLDRDSRSGVAAEKTRNFVIFDDGHIELKAKHRVIKTLATSPLSDPANPNPGLWRRIHDQTLGLLVTLGSAGNANSESSDTIVDAFKRKVTQRYNQIQKTQERSAALRGIDRLPAGQNPMEMITADERGYKLQYLTDNMIRPMAREMANRAISMDDLGLYLYARHAPARNARIAAINPEFRDPANPGSGMSDADAAQIMADFAAQGRIADLAVVAQHIDSMIAYAQQERLNAGLLTPADIAAGFGPADFYVPLRGNENIEPEHEMDFAISGLKGGGMSVSGPESHRMYGRASRADLEEIVGYSITQAQEAIDRGYRNRVGQTMLAMFRNTPDPDFVQIDRVKRVAVWNAKKGQVEYQMQTRIASPEEQQRTIYVKENGEVTKMTFSAKNPSAMRFVKAAKSLGTQDIGVALRWLSVYTRLWSKANTQWNVDFILANAAKDIQTGIVNAGSLNAKGLRRGMMKNLASLRPLRAAWRGSRENVGALLGSTNPWLATYAEFEANGGKLNYNQIDPLADALKNARREIRNAGRSAANPIKLATQFFEVIDDANGAFENMTRLAAYKALRDMGIPAKQAAEAARELTTNFQQHGEWGPKVNAAYGFANASIIGGARLAWALHTKPQYIAGFIMLGMAMDMLNHMLDDEEWDRYSESEKHSSLMVMLPEELGFDIKIPAGHGINAFITVGRKMSELWRGKKNKDGTPMGLWDAASDAGMGLVNSFSPVQGNTFFNVVTPTLFDPVVDIYQNQNNWERPIMPRQPSFGLQKPDSQLAFDNTGQFWKTVASTMNNVGGGNEVVPGWTPLDMSPETYKYVTEQTVGGAGRTFVRMAETVGKGVKGEPIGPNDLPIVRRFAGLPYGAANDKGAEVSAFYDRLNQGTEVLDRAKEMKLRFGKESPTYQSFRKENEKLIEFAEKIEAAEKRLRTLNAAESAAEKGAVRVDGLDRKQRVAIHKAVGLVPPKGKKLTDEQLAKVRLKVREKKEALAIEFNAAFMRDVMKEGQPKPALPVKATASGG